MRVCFTGVLTLTAGFCKTEICSGSFDMLASEVGYRFFTRNPRHATKLE
jgi:hypothetical protein